MSNSENFCYAITRPDTDLGNAIQLLLDPRKISILALSAASSVPDISLTKRTVF
jgi:hypothetical protein